MDVSVNAAELATGDRQSDANESRTVEVTWVRRMTGIDTWCWDQRCEDRRSWEIIEVEMESPDRGEINLRLSHRGDVTSVGVGWRVHSACGPQTSSFEPRVVDAMQMPSHVEGPSSGRSARVRTGDEFQAIGE